ncbi:Homocysteine/selenocysteine methylase (S-methylmethionine-dependent) [Meinhardsimonia xiamenensis]|jgi:homocysteine S-methyltransferase|uniref:Homocysteine/selenocysteine methylase (S-methylmethionine-dependent) n=1 Tax=Meinhardsimonia xiamenensis TaxID=990712 RepID=A0A1G9G6I6_9RHOB|nr:homocysteine S-methyltransferase family protein [Meinhardsimonia xiamenensis]PRX32661.1 homocysteine S-methyltransferase [Meinhardsimonia xiamenensis]SDK96212.1 Homocysteine/selenocysteine methylase (S-methylmethionine-dependent) [Meinhardsimonia xiamenensis]
MTDVTLLDGGLGQEIVRRSGERPTPLWSTQVMLEKPEVVREVHEAYFAAGAEIATANTYAVLRDRLARAGLEHRFEELHETACRLALEARDAHGRGRVAGSLGPIGASYRPDLAPPADEAAEVYAEICAIQAPFVDLWIAETMCSVDQARGALMGALGLGKPVWLSLSVDDRDGARLRSGEPLADVLPLLEELTPQAVLVNCSPPEVMAAALEIIAEAGLPFGAYANGFTHISADFLKPSPTVEALSAREDLTPEAYAEHALGWLEQGASIVGGCCEVGPEHIAHLARRLGRS